MDIPGRLEVTIKINQLPSAVTTDKNGWKGFTIDCGGRRVSVLLRPRMWTRIEEAAAKWPLWLAVISGQMGPAEGSGFRLLEPAVQVFDRQPKMATGAPDEGAPVLGEAPKPL